MTAVNGLPGAAGPLVAGGGFTTGAAVTTGFGFCGAAVTPAKERKTTK